MLQADDEDDAMDQQMKSPFGSSFRTFDATDYKPIGRLHFFLCRLKKHLPTTVHFYNTESCIYYFYKNNYFIKIMI